MAVVEEDVNKLFFNNTPLKQIFVEKLQPKRILTRLSFLTTEQRELIVRAENNHGPADATKHLLHILNDSDLAKGWFRIFKEAIKEEEFEYLSKLLEGYGDDVEDQKVFAEFIQTISPRLLYGIATGEVLVHLQSQKILNDIDCQEIIAANKNEGNFAGNYILLNYISRKAEDWFPKTLWAFKEAEYDDLFKADFPDLKDAESLKDVKIMVTKWKEEKSRLKEASEKEERRKYVNDEKTPKASVFEYQLLQAEESVDQPCQGTNSSKDEEIEPLKLELRKYQVELVEQAEMGENCLIQAPTGSGKTHVALAISQNHLSPDNKTLKHHIAPDKRKVAFLVPYTYLVRQQWNMYMQFLDKYKSIGLRGATKHGERVQVGHHAQENKIIIMTPQLLVEAIKRKDVASLNVFTLIIFDECHHTWGGDPFMKIMKIYLKDKKKGNQIPQIVGLTASVGVGKTSELEKAKEHILKLCANLDCKIVQVTKEKDNLDEYFNNPTDELFEVEGRLYDPFYEKICDMMTWIEEEMQISKEVTTITEEKIFGDKNFIDMLKSTGKPGFAQYKQWVSQLEQEISKIPDARRGIFVVCLFHLRVYTSALEIHLDCRSIDAVHFIHRMFNSNFDYHIKILEWKYDYIDNRLYTRYRDNEVQLKQLCPLHPNPKLKALKKHILRYTRGNSGSRGIVVCRTLNLSLALLSWAKEDSDFIKAGINADRLVGARSSAEQGGITAVQQDSVLKGFREGKTRLLIVTYFEGMDVRECNFDIMYEHATNEITRIQAKGRGRAEGSVHAVVADSDSGKISKEKENMFREKLMYRAITDIQKMSRKEFQQSIHGLQENILLQDIPDGKLQKKSNAVRFTIRCKKCNEFVCNATDLRTVDNAHHLVVDITFYERVKLKKHKKPGVISYGIFKKDKLICHKSFCGQDWGISAEYNSTPVPILKKGTALVYFDEILKKSNALMEWGDLPFEIKEMGDDEFLEYKKGLCDKQQQQESNESNKQVNKDSPLSSQVANNSTTVQQATKSGSSPVTVTEDIPTQENNNPSPEFKMEKSAEMSLTMCAKHDDQPLKESNKNETKEINLNDISLINLSSSMYSKCQIAEQFNQESSKDLVQETELAIVLDFPEGFDIALKADFNPVFKRLDNEKDKLVKIAKQIDIENTEHSKTLFIQWHRRMKENRTKEIEIWTKLLNILQSHKCVRAVKAMTWALEKFLLRCEMEYFGRKLRNYTEVCRQLYRKGVLAEDDQEKIDNCCDVDEFVEYLFQEVLLKGSQQNFADFKVVLDKMQPQLAKRLNLPFDKLE